MSEIKKILFDKVDIDQKKHIITEAYKSEIIMACVILFMQLFMMIAFSLKDGGIFTSWRRICYFSSYMVLFTLTSLFLISYVKLIKMKKYEYCYGIRIAYAIVICLWAAFITFVDQWGGNGLSVYSYMIISLSAIIIMPPLLGTSIFLGSFVLINILLTFAPNIESNIFNYVTNTLFITVIAIFISVRLYLGRITEYKNRIVINQQYQKITEANQLLNEMAITDVLTQLNNRRYLEENVRDIFERNKSKIQYVAGFMVDIDFFKQYNDNYGHQHGDECLIKIGEEIIKFTDEENVYAVRYGGEEFFICYFDINEDNIEAKAEILRETIANCGLKRDDLPLKAVTVSIGVCVREMNEDLEFENLIKMADLALYQAKGNGRNCVVSAG